MSQTTVNLGHVPVNRGEYSSSATYYKDNIVQYNGSSYICNVTEEDISHPVGISGVTPYDSDPASPNTGWAVFANDSSGVGEGVYNVSVDHTTDNQPKIYASLSAALNDIPAAKKKGGMEIKFIFNNSNYAVDKEEGITIQPAGTLITSSPTMVDGTYKASQLLTYFSTLPTATGAGNAVVYYKEVDGTYTTWTITLQSSDNKYVQFRLMTTSFSTTEADWQGVDDEPTAGSNNLIMSESVYNTVIGKYFTQFSVNAGSGHSSRFDQIIVNIPAGNKFQIIGEEISGTWSVNLYITAYYTDGTSEELSGYITKASNSRIYIGSKNIAAVGFYANTSTTAYEVKCILYNYTEKETLLLDEIEDTEDSISIEQKLSSINNRMQVYDINSKSLYIEETNTNYGSIYIGRTNIAVRVYKNQTYTPTTFAAELGVNLVTSPKGVADCIEIPTNTSLVYDSVSEKFVIKNRYNVLYTDIVLLACVDGIIVDFNTKLATKFYLPKIIDSSNLILANNKQQIYSDTNADNIIIEEGYYNGTTSLYIHNMPYLFRAYIGLNYANNTQLSEVLNVSLVTSPSGAQNCIEIPNTSSLVLDLKTRLPAIKNRTNVSENDIVIVACAGGQIREIRTSYIVPMIKQVSNRLDVVENGYDITNLEEKTNEYISLFQSAFGEVEPFIFFSDPHFYQEYDNAVPTNRMNTFLHNVKRIFDETPTNFVISGGDWLSSHKQSTAVKALGQIDGITKGLFGDKYYPVFGNHDNNYQGELDETEGTSANDGTLTNQQMVNLWFRRWNKMYYTFKGSSSLFYVFDTGIDSSPMTDYRWEQVNWFGQSLLSNDELHNIIIMHIVSESGQEFANITPMAQAIADIANAYNQRTSIIVNGITYDFTNKNGKVHCILCGHTHYDYTTTLSNIPVFCITTTMEGNSFDLILLDYAASKLKSIRCGTSGNNREIDIV